MFQQLRRTVLGHILRFPNVCPLPFNSPYEIVMFQSLHFSLSLLICNAKWTPCYQSFRGNKCDLVNISLSSCFFPPLSCSYTLRFIAPRYVYLDFSSFHFLWVPRWSVKQTSKQTTPNLSGLTQIKVYFLHTLWLDVCNQHSSLWNKWGTWFFSSVIF